MAVAGGWGGTPRELLAAAQDIEAKYGRDRTKEIRWGPRTLDIDILLFGNEVIDEPERPGRQALIIPHPRLAERAFALRPLLDLLPEAVEPGTGRTYRVILNSLDSTPLHLL